MKSIKLYAGAKTQTISVNDEQDYDHPINCQLLIDKYPDGVLLSLALESTEIDLYSTFSDSSTVMLFDPMGNLSSIMQHSADAEQSISLKKALGFMLILPVSSLRISPIEGGSFVDHKQDWLQKNKFGVYEYIDEQCQHSCACEKSCRFDDLFFELHYMHAAYVKNLKENKKKRDH